MSRFSTNLAWWLGGIIAFAALNLIFFTVVVGMDVLFHAAPQFVIPLFVPALCAVAGVVTILARSARRLASARGGASPEQATNSAAGAIGWRSAPALHSAVVIRRHNSTNNFNAHERRAYASTV
jgi:hypothetical protein